MKSCYPWTALAVLSMMLAACGDPGPPRKETFPVIGKVLVDGKAVDNIAVRAFNVKGLDTADPTFSSTYTKPDGTFEISTYQAGDGVPEGDYVVTFEWGELNLFTMEYGGPDKLNNRYNDAKTSQTKFTVVRGKPTDIGQVNLTTQ
jgi:hypothetical protein